MSSSNRKFKVGVICGGPSKERGISLNSARSVMDHLGGDDIEILPIYVDQLKNFYEISRSQLYSNTPSDFDFKLVQEARLLDETALAKKLADIDLVFPAIHGAFGEDGELQELLQDYGVPFVGSPAEACRKMFNKHRANFHLSKLGFYTLPFALLKKGSVHNKKIIEDFFEENNLDRAVVKPSAGGSSIGVFSVATVTQALEKFQYIFDEGIDDQAIIEPFCEGKEFTVIVLQNAQGKPVAMVPSEIDMNYDNHQIFDFRRKYLPTNTVTYHCPPRFDEDVTQKIRDQAEDIFTKLGLQDFVRVDGWLMPDGNLWFSDLNPISGMEQNSFMFQQPARLGFSHSQVLRMIIESACRRHNLQLAFSSSNKDGEQKVHILFGGITAERQVSLMSGTNVWFKLRQAEGINPEPFFMDKNGDIWSLPYGLSLDHTVEEILENCENSEEISQKLQPYISKIYTALGSEGEAGKNLAPEKMDLDSFVQHAVANEAFVFIALHGGLGENGELQEKLDRFDIPFNGSNAPASRLCMDKMATGEAITAMGDDRVETVPKRVCKQDEFSVFSDEEYQAFWEATTRDLRSHSLIIKPRSDGCSAGIIRLNDWRDLKAYIALVADGIKVIEPGTFAGQSDIIEMPTAGETDYLLESFVETDTVLINGKDLTYKCKTGWVEVTVGVLEQGGNYHVMNPSLTVAEGDMLSLEEKFQGGTGVNITPPPESVMPAEMLPKVKGAVAQAAKALGIENYARIDLFVNVRNGRVYIIEANSLPGLTPATVIYHQALAEEKPLFPKDFLKKLVELRLGLQKLNSSISDAA